jgi:hypothetical protein
MMVTINCTRILLLVIRLLRPVGVYHSQPLLDRLWKRELRLKRVLLSGTSVLLLGKSC